VTFGLFAINSPPLSFGLQSLDRGDNASLLSLQTMPQRQ
jgi:hypothetical protein